MFRRFLWYLWSTLNWAQYYTFKQVQHDSSSHGLLSLVFGQGVGCSAASSFLRLDGDASVFMFDSHFPNSVYNKSDL